MEELPAFCALILSQETVQQRSHQLCGSCKDLHLRAQDFLASSNVPNDDHQARFQKVLLPPYSVIRDYGCSFCHFVCSAIGHERQAEDLECGLEWVQDGRMLLEDDIGTSTTRRLRVFAVNDDLKDAYLVLMAPADANEQFLGRRVDAASIDMTRVRSWLFECEEHDGCREEDPAPREALSRNPSFRVIDVEQGCVVPFGVNQQQPFLALSYCWGVAVAHSTKKANFTSVSTPGGLSPSNSAIPRTIKDAMLLTKLLGHRYLWVDRYCIVQDDAEDWRSMVTCMDSVYNLAAVTICAADGDANFGIPGITEHSRHFRQSIVTYDQNVEVMASHPAEDFIKESLWNTRAWTFQERICARRCLIFVNGRVFYQCRRSVMCEDLHMENSPRLGGSSTWSLELKDAPGRLFLENPLRQYTKSVELFTQRSLTFYGDKLPAFSAVEALLSENLNSDFRAGLPTAYFDFALLWTPRMPLQRIEQFPSWSWCGWHEPIEYSFSTLEGVLVNLKEWLTSRTWIKWYVHGHIWDVHDPIWYVHSPIWDGKRCGVMGRWGGYAQPNSLMPSEGSLNVNDALSQHQSQLPRHGRDFDRHLVLQFSTHAAFFVVDPVPPVRTSSKDMHPDLHWYSLSDAGGDWCGTVLLSQGWVADMCDRPYQFIAISEARDFSSEEHDSWTFYVPRDRIDSQWDLYYVLLITTDEDGLSERVGLGKVFKNAFKKSHHPGYFWKEVLLK